MWQKRAKMTAIEPVSRRVKLGTGLEYHVLEWGAAADRTQTVVLLHGFLDLSWGWGATVGHGLSERYHVLAPDLRGHGDSDRVGAGGYYHFQDYVADVSSLIDRLALPRVALVGHSMGGSVASYYAGTFPDRLEHLALLEGIGPPEDTLPAPERTAHWIEGWEQALERQPRGYPDVAAAAERLRQNDAGLGHEMSLRLAERGTALASDGTRRFKHDPLHLTRGPYAFRVDLARAFWERIRCPVLFVDGSESPFRGRLVNVEERLASIKNVQQKTLAGAGHMLQRHRPRELANVLVDFLG
jgi:pimeloyl-ACP methyl ester carboxylesterase